LSISATARSIRPTPFRCSRPDVEAAFPASVTRDAAGRIVSVDERAGTFAETTGSRLRASLNFGGPFGKVDPDARRSAFAGVRRPGGGGPGGGGPGGGGARPGGGRRKGRLRR
jgi:hypothetical protein